MNKTEKILMMVFCVIALFFVLFIGYRMGKAMADRWYAVHAVPMN